MIQPYRIQYAKAYEENLGAKHTQMLEWESSNVNVQRAMTLAVLLSFRSWAILFGQPIITQGRRF